MNPTIIYPVRLSQHPDLTKGYHTQQLRENFLIEELFVAGHCTVTYTLHDRMIIMGVRPLETSIELPAVESLTKVSYHLERRECGIINIGNKGSVRVDGTVYELDYKECLYIGKGNKEVIFSSADAAQPADFYVNSCPAHAVYPIAKAGMAEANQVELGTSINSNERTIYQYIHETGLQSCQLVMGFTSFKANSIWNTFPPHTHMRRMEAYCYFDVPENQIIVHLMGEPQETRHLVVKNKQGIISPEWSIHAGVGTYPYSFIWGMAGENKTFTDMDAVPLAELK